MNLDPSYLSHLGEFGTLKNALSSYFNQDWMCDADSEEGIWRLIVRDSNSEELQRLITQIETLLGRSDDEVQQVFYAAADGLPVQEPAGTRRFLEVFQTFIHTYGVPD